MQLPEGPATGTLAYFQSESAFASDRKNPMCDARSQIAGRVDWKAGRAAQAQADCPHDGADQKGPESWGWS